jgi:hypothetical protein
MALSMLILDSVEALSRMVIAFMMRGRHTDPFVSPVGTIAPTDRDVKSGRSTSWPFTAGVISGIWVVSDELGLLRHLSAIKLA